MWAADWKNNRAGDMFILLLDANKAVNSIITGRAHYLGPCISSSLSRCTLSDHTLSGWSFGWRLLSLGLQGFTNEGVHLRALRGKGGSDAGDPHAGTLK